MQFTNYVNAHVAWLPKQKHCFWRNTGNPKVHIWNRRFLITERETLKSNRLFWSHQQPIFPKPNYDGSGGSRSDRDRGAWLGSRRRRAARSRRPPGYGSASRPMSRATTLGYRRSSPPRSDGRRRAGSSRGPDLRRPQLAVSSATARPPLVCDV